MKDYGIDRCDRPAYAAMVGSPKKGTYSPNTVYVPECPVCSRFHEYRIQPHEWWTPKSFPQGAIRTCGSTEFYIIVSTHRNARKR